MHVRALSSSSPACALLGTGKGGVLGPLVVTALGGGRQVRGRGKGALGGVSQMDFASCSGGASSGPRTNHTSSRRPGPRWLILAQSRVQFALFLAIQLCRPGAPRRERGLSILSAQLAPGFSAVSSVGRPLCETASFVVAECGSASPTLCPQALEMNEFDYCHFGISVTNVHVDL